MGPQLNRHDASASPIVVLCTGRSGSTLLRVMLDGHPEIACPPESGIASVLQQVALCVARVAKHGDDVDALSAACGRELADAIMGAYARSQGKARWADKSLCSEEYVAVMRRMY